MKPLLQFTRLPRPRSAEPVRAVLLLLHGIGANEQTMLPLADGADSRMDVLSLRAPLAVGPSAYQWFPLRITDQGRQTDAGAAEQSRLAVLALIRNYRAYYSDRAVYLMGFSQGAVMALITTLTAPEDVQGAVCFSGRFPVEFLDRIAPEERLRRTQLWVAHGRGDTMLPITYGRDVRDLLVRTKTPHLYEEFAGGHEIPELVQKAAHAWLDRLINSNGVVGLAPESHFRRKVLP